MAVRPPSSKPPAGATPAAPPAAPVTPALLPQGAHAGKPGMPLSRPFILIGSRNRAHVHLVSQSVSRAHAAIINTDYGSYVRDLASRTHTLVNGRPVKEAPLTHRDAVQVGTFQFRFSDKTGRGPLETAPRPSPAVLHVPGLDAPVAIENLTLLIGQKPVCDLYLADPAVSTAHAILFELNGRHYIRDLGSRTGTLVNGRPAHQEVLEFGDEITVGPATLRYASAHGDALFGEETAEEDPLAGTGAGAAAVTAVTTAAVLDEPAELDLTVDTGETEFGAAAADADLDIDLEPLAPELITPDLMAPKAEPHPGWQGGPATEPFPPDPQHDAPAEPPAEAMPAEATPPVAGLPDEEEPEAELPVGIEGEPEAEPLPSPRQVGDQAISWPRRSPPTEELDATPADIFGPAATEDAAQADGPVESASTPHTPDDPIPLGPIAPGEWPLAPEPGSLNEPPVPLQDPESSLADLESLAGPGAGGGLALPHDSAAHDAITPWQPDELDEPLPTVRRSDALPFDPLAIDENAGSLHPLERSSLGGGAEAQPVVPPAPLEAPVPLDLELDFPAGAEPKPHLAADEPFGPLTDLDLMSHLEPATTDAELAAMPPVLDLPEDDTPFDRTTAATPEADPVAADRVAGQAQDPADAGPATPASGPESDEPATHLEAAPPAAETVATHADPGVQFESEPPPLPLAPAAERAGAWSPEISATADADTGLPVVDEAAQTFVPPPTVDEISTVHERPAGLPPLGDAPDVEAPEAEAPAFEAPAAEAPVVEVPVLEAPAVDALVAEAPVPEAPVSEAPVAEAPAIEPPDAEVPVAETPAVEAPVADVPAAAPPTTESTFIEAATVEPRAAEVSALEAAPVAFEIAAEVPQDVARTASPAVPPGAPPALEPVATPAKETKRRRKPPAMPAEAPKKKRWWGKKAQEAAAAPATAAAGADASIDLAVETESAAQSQSRAEPVAAAPAAPSASIDVASAAALGGAAAGAAALGGAALGGAALGGAALGGAALASSASSSPGPFTAAGTPGADVTSTVEETVDLTEPTPESALDLGLADELPGPPAAPGALNATANEFTSHAGETGEANATTATDAAFDEMLDEVAGASTGAIIEEPPAVIATDSAPGLDPAFGEVARDDIPSLALADFGDGTPSQPVGASATTPPPPSEQSAASDLAPASDESPASDLAPASGSTPASEAPASDLPPAPEPTPVPEVPPAFDPFRGMGRDEGSFIGGMPLDFGMLSPMPAPALGPPAPQAEQVPPASVTEFNDELSLPRLEDLEEVEPAERPSVGSATTSDDLDIVPDFTHRTAGANVGATTDVRPEMQPEFELDLSLPEPQDLDLPPALPATGAATFDPAAFDPAPFDRATFDRATFDPGAVDAGSLGHDSLDLPELPPLDVPVPPAPPAAPTSVATSNVGSSRFDPSTVDPERAAELHVPPPGAPATRPIGDAVDPLAFTEAEAETLQLLPFPQPPRAESPIAEPGQSGPPRSGQPAARPGATPPAPRAVPPPPARAGRAQGSQKYPSKTPPPARVVKAKRKAQDPFEAEGTDLAAEFDIPPFTPARGGSAAPPGIAGAAGAAGAVARGAFDGLALGAVREADVFSPMAFGGGRGAVPAAEVPARQPGDGRTAGDSDADLAAALDLPSNDPAFDVGLTGGTGGSSALLPGLTGLAGTGAASQPPSGRRGPRAPMSPRDMGRGGAGVLASDPASDPASNQWGGPGGPGTPHEFSHDPGAAPAPPRRRTGIGVLLVLMILCLAAAAGGILAFGPRPQVEVVGTLQFDRLRDLTELDRRRFEDQQRSILSTPDFRLQARQILKVADDQMAYGFLGEEVEAVKAYEQAVKAAQVKERTNNFVVYYRGQDPVSDRARMQAVLKALYARNGALKDDAATSQAKYEKAQQDLKDKTEQVESKKKEIAAIKEQGERAPDLESKHKALQADYEKFRAAARVAQAEVDRLQALLEKAESPAEAPADDPLAPGDTGPTPEGDTDGGATAAADARQFVAISSSATPVAYAEPAGGQEKDPQVRQLRAQLDQLNAGAASARAERARSLEQASKALDAALEQFNAEVGDAGNQLEGESQLRRYVQAGQRMQDALRKASADLAQQQKGDRDYLSDMKRRLAEKGEQRLKEAWANDPELRRLEEDLAIKERHRNAALGGGLRKDAAVFEPQIAQLSKQIDDRRDRVGTGRAYAGEVQELREFIDRTLKRMEEERARNDRRMEELLAGFAAEAPAIEKLPEDQKKLAAGLEKRSRELGEARKLHAAALAAADTAAAADGRQQEQQAAALQARITARRRQVALVAETNLTARQQEEREAKVRQLRIELAAARRKSDGALAAAERVLQEMLEVRGALAAANESANRIAEAQRQQVALEQALAQARATSETVRRDSARAVRPVEPGDDAVAVNPAGEDRRLLYVLYAGGAIVVAFSVLMWLTATGSDGPPLADRATYDVLAERPTGAPRGQAGANGAASDDDEQPLTV